MGKLHQDFKEFIKLLNEDEVEYLVVGAFAMAFHGFPRFTGDIDFWINNSEKNAKKVFSTIKKFGFPVDKLSEKDFSSKDIIFQMGFPPVRIDVITSVEGLNFNKSFPDRIEKVIDGLKVCYINKKDLMKNKKAAGRKKDLADYEILRKSK